MTTAAVKIIESLEAEKNGKDDGMFAGLNGVLVAWDGEFEYYRASAQQSGEWAPLTRDEAIAIVAANLDPAAPATDLAFQMRTRRMSITVDGNDIKSDIEISRAWANANPQLAFDALCKFTEEHAGRAILVDHSRPGFVTYHAFDATVRAT